MPNHCCVRVYNNGDRTVEWREPARLAQWLEYNTTFRPGCALFVDGEVRQTGYLGPERAAAQAQRQRNELAQGLLRDPRGQDRVAPELVVLL